VIDAEGKQLGILTLAEALDVAAKSGLDLVEVAPQGDPPVCKVMDYGKFRYQQSKKLHTAKKSASVIQIKEIRLRPKTEEHDLQVKIRHIRKFLEEQNKVKVTMMFRGREIAYSDQARRTMEEIRNTLAELSTVEQFPRLEGRHMTMYLAPKKQAAAAEKGK
jgi:translation initiation factor IF-3